MDEALSSLQQAIVEGNHKQAVAYTNQLIEGGAAPQAILNDGLVAGMSRVGELFKQGEYFVPEMPIAARAMKSSLQILPPPAGGTPGIEPVRPDCFGVRGPATCMKWERIWPESSWKPRLPNGQFRSIAGKKICPPP